MFTGFCKFWEKNPLWQLNAFSITVISQLEEKYLQIVAKENFHIQFGDCNRNGSLYNNYSNKYPRLL